MTNCGVRRVQVGLTDDRDIEEVAYFAVLVIPPAALRQYRLLQIARAEVMWKY